MRRLCTDSSRSYPGRSVSWASDGKGERDHLRILKRPVWQHAGEGQKSAEGIVVLRDEGPNEEVRRGHL